MPTRLHETLVELFEHNPPLAAQLLAEVFKINLPAWRRAEIQSAQISEIKPAEGRADALITLVGNDGKPALAAVIEVQLDKKPDKLYTWPIYLTHIRARKRCRTLILVICPRRSTAEWANQAIDLGPGSTVTPFVLGPDLVPVITDPTQATAHPELAVLSALAHGTNHPQWQQVLEALWAGLLSVDPTHQGMYADIVHAALSGAARKHLEDLMNPTLLEPASPLFRRHWLDGKAAGKAEGKAEGEAAAVLAVLAARGIDVPASARERIATCTDLDQLDVWIGRAATASSVEELFD